MKTSTADSLPEKSNNQRQVMTEKHIPVMVNCVVRVFFKENKRLVHKYDNGDENHDCCVHGKAFLRDCSRCDSYFEVTEKMLRQMSKVVGNA